MQVLWRSDAGLTFMQPLGVISSNSSPSLKEISLFLKMLLVLMVIMSPTVLMVTVGFARQPSFLLALPTPRRKITNSYTCCWLQELNLFVQLFPKEEVSAISRLHAVWIQISILIAFIYLCVVYVYMCMGYLFSIIFFNVIHFIIKNFTNK